jgi:hypothetical protein
LLSIRRSTHIRKFTDQESTHLEYKFVRNLIRALNSSTNRGHLATTEWRRANLKHFFVNLPKFGCSHSGIDARSWGDIASNTCFPFHTVFKSPSKLQLSALLFRNSCPSPTFYDK